VRSGDSICFFVSQDKIGKLMQLKDGTTHIVFDMNYEDAVKKV